MTPAALLAYLQLIGVAAPIAERAAANIKTWFDQARDPTPEEISADKAAQKAAEDQFNADIA